LPAPLSVGGQVQFSCGSLATSVQGKMSMEWSLLHPLSEPDRRALLARCTRQRFSRGGFVFHEGETGDSVHLIEVGTVAVRVSSPAGDVVTLDVLGPGDAFGEQALIGESSRRSATVVALERTETRRFTRKEFEVLVADHPSAAIVVAQMLDGRLRATSQALLEALYFPADTRVLRRLAHLATLYDAASIPLTQDDLASLAGTTRQTVNRVLGQAQEDGLVRLSRGRITVADLPELARRSR
jgi:CRP/FNR family transcriptional regulator, cyclic AMP receptor protein